MDRLNECRACRAPDPYLFLAMGNHPPANMFVRPEQLGQALPAFPLNAQVCLECGLIQVADQVPADFFRHYLYLPSTSQTMQSHFAEFGTLLVREARRGLIVDIGSNDGLLLSHCRSAGGRTLGVDPAANLAEIARRHGVETFVDYFSPETAQQIRALHGAASVMTATNTFNHIGDLHAFMRAVSILLDDDGLLVIEVPRAADILRKNEFDNIYHEHLSECSLLSIVRLCSFFDLRVADVELIPVHAGSMRVFIRRSRDGEVAARVDDMLSEERSGGMLAAETYDAFARRIAAIRDDLVQMLTELKRDGKRIAGYGAPAKGNTLLNYFGIGPALIDFLVDRSPLKQGLYTPGSLIPIKGPAAIRTEKPDVLVILAWNFLDEIMAQQASFLARGGRMVVPLPQPTMIGE